MNNLSRLSLLFLFILFSSMLSAQNEEWTGQLDPNTNNSLHSIFDNDGNMIVAGSFSETADLDPGEGEDLYTAYFSTDIFIEKLSPEGDVLWIKIFQCTNTDYFLSNQNVHSIVCDASNNIILIGEFEYLMDFNPGTAVYELEGIGSHDGFVAKLNSNGDFVWAKQLGGVGPVNEYLSDVAVDNSSNIFITGTFMQTIDMDPGTGVYELESSNNSVDFFILKLNSSGNFSWVKHIGQYDIDRATSIALDASNNIYVTGLFGGTVDFDPGTGTTNLYEGSGVSDAFFLKLNSSGNFVWVGALASLTTEEGHDVEVNEAGIVYFTGKIGSTSTLTLNGNSQSVTAETQTNGKFILQSNTNGDINWVTASNDLYDITDMEVDESSSVYITGILTTTTVDMDPGLGIYNLTGIYSSFIQKLDADGLFVWAVSLSEYSNSIDLLNDVGDILFAGFSENYYVLNKFNQDVCWNMIADITAGSDITCSANGLAIVTPDAGLPPYTFQWNDELLTEDSTVVITTPGIYSVIVEDANGCNRQRQVAINGPSVASAYDLKANAVAGDFRPGFDNTITLDAFNDGCELISGELKLVLDAQLIFNSALPSPDVISGDTLTWLFADIIYETPHITPSIFVTTSEEASIGDTICLNVILNPSMLDANALDNFKTYCYPVINGYDPNDKQVYPKGWMEEGFVTNNQTMTYTVRFQNTGNAEAINIHILDTIHSNLDISSLRIMGQSHAMTVEIPSNNVIDFRFDNIMLPDSNSNEAASHGYVIYEIDQLSDLAMESSFSNSAAIYFDFNDPIYTNTVTNQIFACEMMGEMSDQNVSNCDGASVELISDFNYVEDISWNIDNELVGVNDTLLIENQVVGSALFTLLVSNPYCENEVDFTVVTYANPTAPEIEFDGVTLTTSSSGNLQWYLEGEELPGETNALLVPLVSGNYGLSTTDINGCTTFIENYFATYVHESNFNFNFQVYPNPATDQIQFVHDGNLFGYQVIIYDVIGTQIFENVFYTNSFKIDLQKFTAGHYHALIISENNRRDHIDFTILKQ
jgi:uncharacterized repeat protein (TIGR01451 family)